MASGTENRYVNLYVNGQHITSSYNDMRRDASKLRIELNKGKLSQEQYNAKVKELQNLNKKMAAHRQALRGVGSSWKQLKTIAAGVIGGNVILTAFQKLTDFIPNMISQNAKLADSYSDVRKTTGLTAAGVEDLNGRLKTIDTRTPRARLLELARDAGKLGISGVENISQFVKAADQIDVSLGEDLGDGAIKQIGKLNNLFKISDVYGYEQGMLKIGSVINELGASSEASEAEIVNFMNRLAGVADQADIPIQAIAGMGATLDSLGQRTETSGTAVSQAIVGMFKDTPTYAKVAGKSVEEFSKTLNEDANEAFIQFLEGLNGNNEGLTVMTKKFDDLGIDGSKAITVLSALSGNTQKLREQQTIANQAFDDGISLTNEFNIKNTNAAGNLEKIGRAIRGAWVNSGIKKMVDGITSSLAGLIDLPVSENIEQQRIRFNGLMTALTDTNTAETDKLEIIKQLHESYGDKLGDLDLEKASLEEIQTAMAQVNQQYIIEIALMTQREKIHELAQDKGKVEGERLNRTIEANKQLAESNSRLGTSYGTVDEAIEELGKTAIEQYDSGLKRVVQLNAEAQELSKLRQYQGQVNQSKAEAANLGKELAEEQGRELEMIEQLKKDYPQLGEIIDQTYSKINGVATKKENPEEGGSETDTGGGVADFVSQSDIDSAQEKYEALLANLKAEDEKLAIAKLEGRAKEEAQVHLHYDKLKASAEGHANEIARIEAQRAEALAQIDAKYAEEKAQVQEKINAALAGENTTEHPEIIAARNKYAELISLAEQYGIDVTALKQATADAEREIAKELARVESEQAYRAWQSKVSIYDQGASDIIGGLGQYARSSHQLRQIEIAGMEDEDARRAASAKEAARFAKHQQELGLIQMGVSAGVSVANAVKSASALPWPANLAAAASAVGAVIAFMGQARQVFSSNDIPEYALGSSNANGSYIAGESGREIIEGDRVIPADITQKILAAQAFTSTGPQPNFSLINDGLTYTQSQQVASGVAGAGGAIDLTPLLIKMDSLQRTMAASNRSITFAKSEHKNFESEYEANEARVVYKPKRQVRGTALVN